MSDTNTGAIEPSYITQESIATLNRLIDTSSDVDVEPSPTIKRSSSTHFSMSPDMDPMHEKFIIGVIVVLGLLAMVGFGVFLLVFLSNSSSDNSKPTGADGCKVTNDSDNFKVATKQCGSSGTVYWDLRHKMYKCKCKDGTLENSCTHDYTDAAGGSHVFTGVPYCAADGTAACGCGGTSADTLINSANGTYSWCSNGGGAVGCKLPPGTEICSTQDDVLLGQPECTCGTTEVGKNVCSASDGGVNGGTWSCVKPSSGDSYVDCLCGASKGSFVSSASGTCPTFTTTGALNEDMASGAVPLKDFGCTECTCDSNASTWGCTVSAPSPPAASPENM